MYTCSFFQWPSRYFSSQKLFLSHKRNDGSLYSEDKIKKHRLFEFHLETIFSSATMEKNGEMKTFCCSFPSGRLLWKMFSSDLPRFEISRKSLLLKLHWLLSICKFILQLTSWKTSFTCLQRIIKVQWFPLNVILKKRIKEVNGLFKFIVKSLN